MNRKRSWAPSWKLLGGLVVLIGAAALFATSFNGAGVSWLSFLPFLLLLACPLMMVFMMGSMTHAPGSDEFHSRMHGAHHEPIDLTGLSPDDQIQALRGELTRMNWRQEVLRQDLEQLEASRGAEPKDTAGAC